MCLDPRKPESRAVLGAAQRPAPDRAATADLVRRLRKWVARYYTEFATAELMREAADAIERLDAGRATPPA